MSRPAPTAGFTLFELAMVLAMVALLAGLTVPGFQRFSRELQLSRSANALLVALHQARGAAIARGVPVALHVGAEAGWRVVAEPPGGEELLSHTQLPVGILIQGNRSRVVFWPATRAGTTATFMLCDAQRLAAPRAIIVSQTGRPRSARAAADGSALECANA